MYAHLNKNISEGCVCLKKAFACFASLKDPFEKITLTLMFRRLFLIKKERTTGRIRPETILVSSGMNDK